MLPAFLIAFVLLAILRTGGDALTAGTAVAQTWSQAVGVALSASDIFLVCGMTAIGLNVSLADLRGIGARALGAALMVAATVCAVSLSMTYAIHTFFSH